MKITDPDVIKNGEKDLIDAVKDDLDLDTIKEIMQNKMNAKTISSKGGEIVVHNNEIAFRLDFNIEISGSLMFDRQGNYIPESNGNADQEELSQDFDSDEQLEINLPDYDLDDESEQERIEQGDDIDENGDIHPDESHENDALPIEDLDPLTDTPEQDMDAEIDPEIDLEPGVESDIKDEDTIQNEMIDDDIDENNMNDILKESRDFWDLKKDE